jgi:hypothetical protein
MKIWLLIDTYSSLYCWQWMGHHDHEYIIYRDQLNQHSSQTTLAHHHTVMKQWLDYLLTQGVDHIVCPPVIELHYQSQYPQILPVFQQYIEHNLSHSIVGKIWFVGSTIQCQSINLHRWDSLASWNLDTPWGLKNGAKTVNQSNNRHFNANFPIRTSPDHHLTHRLTDHKPDHYTCNTLIKQLLRPLKDASVDTVIWLDWSYYACDVSRSHHCRKIKRHRSDIFQQIQNSLNLPASPTWYSVAIHHTGTLRDLQQNKKLRWMLARGQNHEITQIIID